MVKDSMELVSKSTAIIQNPVKEREGDTDQEILKEAYERAIQAYDYHKDNMDRAEHDLSMIFGDHYSQEDLAALEAENRLALTFNKLPQFINKVTGAQRSSVQSINVSPTGNSIGAEEPSVITMRGKTIKLSSVLSDLIRDIEYQSNAVAWYKMAFKHALEGGFGWLRVLTDYQDDGFDLDIKIKGVRDRWSVLVDPNAVEPDKSDANFAFIHERMSRKEFDKRYPGKSCEVLPGVENNGGSTFWGSEEEVTVSEYFRREPYKKTLVLLDNGEIFEKKDTEEFKEELAEMGRTIVKERDVTAYKVIWRKISAGDTLEDDIEFPTSTIPVVPMIGRELDTRKKRRTKGLITDAVDAQLALNRMRSSALERIDSSPLAPFIATDKAIEGYEPQWAEANTTKFSTLVYRKGEERPVREVGATMPTAELQVTSVLDDDMKASIGIFNASLGETSNEISGKAIKARQSEADVGTYEFVDNYQMAIRRIGLLVVEMIPKVYDTERIVRIRGLDGSQDTIKINQVVMDEETGEEKIINDLSLGKYTVVISSGASYETKREENADQILTLMDKNPQIAQVGADLLVKNLDFSESDVLAKRLERMVPPNLLSKEKQEELAKDAPPPEPTPEQIQAESEQKKLEMEAQIKKLELESKVKIEEFRLKTAEVNLKIKELELSNKEKEDERNIVASENQRRDTIAKSIAERIKDKASQNAEPAAPVK